MAYADQTMSGNKVAALIIVALIHVAVGYALVTGLAYSATKKLIERVTTVDVKEPEPTETPPPPPPDKTPPPPVVAPPPPINVAIAPPPIAAVPVAPPAPPLIVHTAAPPPPPPPAPRVAAKRASPRGSAASWANSNDYPSRALREEREGVTRFSVTIDTEGKVTSCSVTGSSGSPDLDDTTCKLIQRRARFKPATDENGNPVNDSWSSAVRWEIPK